MKKINLLITLLTFTIAIQACENKRVRFATNKPTEHYYFDPLQETDSTFEYYKNAYMYIYKQENKRIQACKKANRNAAAKIQNFITQTTRSERVHNRRIHKKTILSRMNRIACLDKARGLERSGRPFTV